MSLLISAITKDLVPFKYIELRLKTQLQYVSRGKHSSTARFHRADEVRSGATERT